MFERDLVPELQDMRYLKWTRVRRSSGTAGSYLKAYGENDGRRIYYKISNFDTVNGITGHECVNELIVDRLLTVLGIVHIHYQLIHARIEIEGKEYTSWICASEDFKRRGDSKIALDDYYELHRMPGEEPLSFCIRMGWEDYIYEMLVVDYIILNRDRHGANIEILKDKSDGSVRPAPLFDHGISLIYSCRTAEEALKADPLEDKPVQCFVGSRSVSENLKLIPDDKRPALRRLTERDRAVIFDGLERALPAAYTDKIWEMITERLDIYEGLQDS